MKKKVLFVNPRSRNVSLGTVPPLVLATLASYLQKQIPEIEIKILDEISGEHFSRQTLQAFTPDYVAVTCMTEFCYRAYEIAQIAKSEGITTIVGGKHPSIFPEEAAQHFDYVIAGDGEAALCKIIEGNAESRIVNGTPLEDIDEIPPMPWHLLPVEKYLTAHHKGQYLRNQYPYDKVGNIHTDRGCPNSCIYCYNSTEKFKKVRYHSPERVMHEIKYLVDNYHIDHLHFIDDNLLVRKSRLEKICRMLIDAKLGITWDCAASSNAIIACKDMLPLIFESGCKAINIGLESMSDRVLKMIKGPYFSVEKNKESIRLCRENGIRVISNFLIGIPTETQDELNQTVDFIKQKHVDFISIQIVKPYPGTKLWQICKEMNLIPPDLRWDGYFNCAFHEKFSYEYLSEIIIDCNAAYIPYTFSRTFRAAITRPGDAIRKLFFEKEGVKIIKKLIRK